MALYPEKDVNQLQNWPDPIKEPTLYPEFGIVPNDQAQPEVDINLLPGVPGQRGPAGPPGPKGETPTISYIHNQSAVSSTWSITHNLGFYPNIVTQDSAGTTIEGTVVYNTINQVTVSFSVALTGIAYLS